MQREWTDSGLGDELVARIVALGTRDVPIVHMTHVQTGLVDAAPDADVFAVSGTGTGKTLAVLAPILRDMRAGTVRCAVILSPTNALRAQHVRTATALAPPDAVVKSLDTVAPGAFAALANDQKPAIVVATPAKVLAAIAGSGGAESVGVVVLDEVDELVANPSFKREVERVVAAMPNARVIAVTATTSAATRAFASGLADARGRPLAEIDASSAAVSDKSTKHTHQLVSVPADSIFGAIETVVRDELAAGSKAIVFFPTAAYAQFAHDLLAHRGVAGIVVLHSKMSSSAATRAEREFRDRAQCALFASNVMARGIDVVDVNVVVQIGISSAAEYAQRVGRSGRAGREGRGVLIAAAEIEAPRLRAVIERERSIKFDERSVAVSTMEPGTIRGADRAFTATLGAYKTHAKTIGMTMRDAVDTLTRAFRGAGQSIPTLTPKLARKLGLTGDDGVDVRGGGGSSGPSTSMVLASVSMAIVSAVALAAANAA